MNKDLQVIIKELAFSRSRPLLCNYMVRYKEYVAINCVDIQCENCLIAQEGYKNKYTPLLIQVMEVT